VSFGKGAQRLLKYIKGLKKALAEARSNLSGDGKALSIIKLAETYLKDSTYYYEKGDLETAFVTVAYAEGLLDALRYLGLTDFKWLKKPEVPKVVVGGTFDIIHPGHIEFLKEASKYGKVYVIVARDKNVLRFKGREPINDERHRLEVIKGVRYVYDAVLGDEKDFLKPILNIRPKYVVLGPDQPFDPIKLKEELRSRGVDCEVIKIKERFCKGTSSTSEIVKKIVKMFCKENFSNS